METQVMTRHTCPDCNGLGVTESYLWQQFYLRGNAHLEHDQTLAWFRDNYSLANLPPEEENCGNCEGTGTIQEWKSLTELLPMLDKEATQSARK